MRTELARAIDEVLLPHGFKKKKNTWFKDCGEFVKVVQLRKSNFGESFFLSYGINIKSLPLDVVDMHVSSDLPEIFNMIGFATLLRNRVLNYFNQINTESDILSELKSRPNLNVVPLMVKKHFDLPI